MLEGRFMLYVLVYSITGSLGVLRHMIKSSSAVAYIVSFFFIIHICHVLYFVFIAVVFAYVFLCIFGSFYSVIHFPFVAY